MEERIKNIKGFTLIEVLMTIILMGIIGLTVFMLLYQGVESFDALDKRKDVMLKGNLAVERMTRELRLIACTQAGNNCNPQAADITNMGASELRFVNTDYRGRGLRLDAGAIKLRQGSTAVDPEDALIDGVNSLTFEYFKQDGTTASAVNDIWRIDVSFTAASGDESMPFKASVHPRSFR